MDDSQRKQSDRNLRKLWKVIESHRFAALATLSGTLATIIATGLSILTYWGGTPSLEELHPNLDRAKTLSVLAKESIKDAEACRAPPNTCALLDRQAQQHAAAERLAKEIFSKIMGTFNCPIWSMGGFDTGPGFPKNQETPAKLRLEALLTVEQLITQLVQLVSRSNLNIKAATFVIKDEFRDIFRPNRVLTGEGSVSLTSYEGIAATKEKRWKQAQQFSRTVYDLCQYVVDECPIACVLHR